MASEDAQRPTLELRKTYAGPIDELSMLDASLLFAQLSQASYLHPDYVRDYAPQLGLELDQFIDRDGAQAYVFESDTDRIIACRGTEPTDWNDVKADVNALTVVAETVGRVHRGFKREVDDLWPKVEEELSTKDMRKLWFTGHSLGGAMATISAGRCYLAHIPQMPEHVYTFGAPRVGTKRYVQNVDLNITRWVNNNDMVTRVPPAWLGYQHVGQRKYINAYGKVRRLTRRQRAKDRWRGFVAGLKEGKIDHFTDHSIAGYVAHIADAVEEHDAGQTRHQLEETEHPTPGSETMTP
ncbi:MAG TPA: lipase family protein [Acidimicrobiia bacterium]|jgi:triacylglycerol lipase|nr:lipase family protein [Acidimicrobiia bacterium]